MLCIATDVCVFNNNYSLQVSSNCRRVRLFDVDYDVEEEEGDAIEEDEAL